MSDQPLQPITYDPSGALIEGTGLARQDFSELAPRLQEARDEVLGDLELLKSGAAVPPEKQPLDANFIDLPDRILGEYREKQAESELGRILQTAGRLRETVDRVVVLGIGGSYMGTRALFEACCHPYHNELSRTQRGGRPRIYFEGNNVDNDALQGLLDLLDGSSPDAEDDWAIIAVSKSGGTMETAVALRKLLAALGRRCRRNDRRLAELVVPVTGREGRLLELARAVGCPDVFHVPDGVGGRYSVLSAVGLLPAATVGLDVVRLLEGAAAMNARFASDSPEENIVLRYVAVGHLLELKRGATTRVLSVWSRSLEALGLWYDQLLAESLGKQQRGALPLTAVNTRDLHSRGQQHQQGRRDKSITNVIVDRPRDDPLPVGTSELDQDRLNDFAERTLPDIMTAAVTGTNRAYNDDGRPTADLHLPSLDEGSLGQLLQMFMLATAVEGRLVGINPYGQPGVEAYKTHMNAILRGQSSGR